jgi:hypothetical protein
MRNQTNVDAASATGVSGKADPTKINVANEIRLENEEDKIEIECSMSYVLVNGSEKEISSGECDASINKEYLIINQKFGEILPFHLRDIIRIEEENYRIILSLTAKEKLTLFSLGYCFEDFLRTLTDQRNDVIVKDLLMNETARESDIEMEFIHISEQGSKEENDSGKIRLYETGLVVMPKKCEVFRIPYSDITKVQPEDQDVRISTESGEQLFVKKLGSEHDHFIESLSNIYRELQNKAVSSLKTLLPDADPITLRKIANIMREGRAARRVDIETINPRVWNQLEKRITTIGLSESYNFLKELAHQERICIGFKRGLMGDLTGEYIWFLMPIYNIDDKEHGNAIAMEAAEDDGDGKATYFFRIVSRQDYPDFKNIAELDQETDSLIKEINRCMIEINFRREPVYLTDERFDESQYSKYKIAVEKIPSLRTLRTLFIGRVIHSSPEQWREDVLNLLRYNVITQDDHARWSKDEKQE